MYREPHVASRVSGHHASPRGDAARDIQNATRPIWELHLKCSRLSSDFSVTFPRSAASGRHPARFHVDRCTTAGPHGRVPRHAHAMPARIHLSYTRTLRARSQRSARAGDSSHSALPRNKNIATNIATCRAQPGFTARPDALRAAPGGRDQPIGSHTTHMG